MTVGWLPRDFSLLFLVQVVQGTAVVTMAPDFVALWKQEKLASMSRARGAAPGALGQGPDGDMGQRRAPRLRVGGTVATSQFDASRIASRGISVGIRAFSAANVAAPTGSAALLYLSATQIRLGGSSRSRC